jgi:hypothetical protein
MTFYLHITDGISLQSGLPYRLPRIQHWLLARNPGWLFRRNLNFPPKARRPRRFSVQCPHRLPHIYTRWPLTKFEFPAKVPSPISGSVRETSSFEKRK